MRRDTNRKEVATLSRSLEAKARAIVRAPHSGMWKSSWTGAVRRQLALALDHLAVIRQQCGTVEAELCERECAIGTEILAINNRLSSYDPRRHTETHRMTDRKHAVQDARGRNCMAVAESERLLQSQLLTLLNEYFIRGEGA